MEFVSGRALDQLIFRKGLQRKEALKYAIDVADALASAHAADIVHRDLKQGYIMVNESGSSKVLDFGFAKLTENSAAGELAPKTDSGTIVGTVSYMSPEQAEGKKVGADRHFQCLIALIHGRTNRGLATATLAFRFYRKVFGFFNEGLYGAKFGAGVLMASAERARGSGPLPAPARRDFEERMALRAETKDNLYPGGQTVRYE
jgi:serine/threonine protein kinase